MDPAVLVPKRAEEVFPLEVWSMISNNLDSPSDLLNLSKTCKKLAELLKPKRTTFLMPKVFPILYKNGYLQADKEEDEAIDYNDDHEEEKAEVRKIRLVSRAWKESVDVYFQNHPGHHDIGFENYKDDNEWHDDPEPFSFLPYHFDENNILKLESLVAKDFTPDCSPFITRYVKFNVCIDYPEKRLQTQFKKLLERFGSHIWTCGLHFGFDISVPALYKLVRSYLTLMPNLRSLNLFFTSMKKRKTTSSNQLKMLLEKQPFPKLEHLTTLYMTGVPFPLDVGILMRNEQVVKLSLPYAKDPVPESIVNVESLNIQELALTSNSKVNLMQMQKLTWPLKALVLNVGEDKWATVFAIVSTFKNTLEILNLSVWKTVEDNRQLTELMLEMPNLKKFKLEIHFEPKTIDFLVGCAALQEVEVCIFPSDEKEENGDEADLPEDEGAVPIIQINDCFTSMHMSNVWELLPMLQLIKIIPNGFKTLGGTTTFPVIKYRFTRRQHEKYEKMKAAL